jgi:hypothetical protein
VVPFPAWAVLPSCPSFFKEYIGCARWFHHSISHKYIWYFNHISCLYHLLFLCHPAPLSFNSFPCFIILSSYTGHPLPQVWFMSSESAVLGRVTLTLWCTMPTETGQCPSPSVAETKCSPDIQAGHISTIKFSLGHCFFSWCGWSKKKYEPASH